MKFDKESTFNNQDRLVLYPNNKLYSATELLGIKEKIVHRNKLAKSYRPRLSKIVLNIKQKFTVYPVFSREQNNITVAIFLAKKINCAKNSFAYSIYFEPSLAETRADDPNSRLINVVSHGLCRITPRAQFIIPSYTRKSIYRNNHPWIVTREPHSKKIKRLREEIYAKTRKIERNRLEFLHSRISALKDHLLIVKMTSDSSKMDSEKEIRDLRIENSMKMTSVTHRHNFILSHKAYNFSKHDVLSASAP